MNTARAEHLRQEWRRRLSATLEPLIPSERLRQISHQLFGDAEYHAKKDADEDSFVHEKWKNPPPPKSVREKLKRWYGWSKRG